MQAANESAAVTNASLQAESVGFHYKWGSLTNASLQAASVGFQSLCTKVRNRTLQF